MKSTFMNPRQTTDGWTDRLSKEFPDDPRVGLRQEPFVSGADDIIDILTEDIPDAATGFKLVFSPEPFPGFTARFDWNRSEHGGNWYTWSERGIEGWLCPALFKYFATAPKAIYVQASPKTRPS